MLRRFASSHKETPDRIAQALEAGDWAEAERLTHTLKGVTGNIGAHRIAEAAESLEKSLRERLTGAPVEQQEATVRQLMSDLIARINDALPSIAVIGEAARDPAELSAFMAQFRELLANDDAEATEVFRRHAGLLASAFPDDFAQIERDVLAFEFEKALRTLDRTGERAAS